MKHLNDPLAQYCEMDEADEKVTHMTGQVSGGKGPGAAKLRDAMRKARVAQSVHNDVIVDLRETELARLEVLADALEPIFDEIPAEAEQFECSLVQGTHPRLWIDMLAFVDMARDKRTYRFVSDTRSGRQVMLETTNVSAITERITDYIAHRLVERERSLTAAPPHARRQGFVETDLVEQNLSQPDGGPHNGGRHDVSHAGDGGPVSAISSSDAPKQNLFLGPSRWREGTLIGIAYLAGMLMGASIVILLALYLTS